LVKDLERTPRERRRLYIDLHLKLHRLGQAPAGPFPGNDGCPRRLQRLSDGGAAPGGRLAGPHRYHLFMSPVSVAGYAQELFGAARRW